MTTTTNQTRSRGRRSAALRDEATRRRDHRPVLEPLERHVLLSIFTVTSAADNVTGSLRQAIVAANAHPNGAAPDEIDFDIPGTGLHTINLALPLPTVTDPLVIDGYTQPGSSPNTLAVGDNAVLNIELNGSGAGTAIGLTITAGGSTVRGLVINRFNGDGIYLAGSGAVNDLVEGNFIGTDATGTQAFGNMGFYGDIRLTQFDYSVQPTQSPSHNTIGGTTVEARNIISGNGGLAGVFLGPGAADNVVQGNLIGTDASGTRALGNAYGVYLLNAGLPTIAVPRNTIGGAEAGAGNVISGNRFDGIRIAGGPSNVVQGNLIGTDATGTRALGNGGDGVTIGVSLNEIGGLAAGEGNTIAFNGNAGVASGPSGNAILSNSIHDNAGLGISGVGSYTALTAAESSATGTTVFGTLNSIPNTTFTLQFFSNPAPDPSGFGEGQSLLGTMTVTSDANGNASFRFTTSSPVPFGQWVSSTATDPNGNTSEFSGDYQVPLLTTTRLLTASPPSPTPLDPVALDGVVALASGGVISTGTVTLSEDGRPVSGGQGVSTLDAAGHFHFGLAPLAAGSHVFTAVYSGTTVFAPGTSAPLTVVVLVDTTRLAPVLTSAATAGPLTAISATLDASPSTTYSVEFFSNAVADPSGFGQGQTYIGSIPVTTDASGHASFTFQANSSRPGRYVTATATDPQGNTSEFSRALEIPAAPTTTTLATSPASPVSGRPLTLVAAVGGPAGSFTPGGLVTFIDRNRVLASVALDASGHASIVIPAPDGLDTFAAVYDGSIAYLQSVSAVSAVTAARVSPAVVLVGPSNVSLLGQPVPFVAIVVPSGGVTPTGSVAFGENGQLLAVVPLDASGRATFITSTLSPGHHALVAAYLGDSSDNIALSNFVTQDVLLSLAFDGPTVTSASAPTSTSVKVAFSRPLLVGPAQDTANYAIIGPDGRGLTIKSAVYDPTDNSVALTTRQPLKPGVSYRITIDGLRIGRVVDVYGIALDGQHNGRPGSKFIGTIKFTGHVATSPHPTGPRLKALAQVHKKGR